MWGGFRRKILTSMLGLMGMGAGTLIWPWPRFRSSPWLSGVPSGRAGQCPLTMGPFMAVIQSTVEPGMQARIYPCFGVSARDDSDRPMVAGPAADRVGIQAWFFIAGVLCILMDVTGDVYSGRDEYRNERGAALNELSPHKQTV